MDIRLGGPRHVGVHRGEQVEKVQHRIRNVVIWRKVGRRSFCSRPFGSEWCRTTLELQIMNSELYVEPSLLALLYEQQHGAVHRDVYPSFRYNKTARDCRGSPERLLGGTKQLREEFYTYLKLKVYTFYFLRHRVPPMG